MPPYSFPVFESEYLEEDRNAYQQSERNYDDALERTKRRASSTSTDGDSDDEDFVEPIEEYIPVYLRQFVIPYHGDFCYSPFYHPVLIGQLLIEGFLTIANSKGLLPKLHENRCVIVLNSSSNNNNNNGGSATGSNLHISKSCRKKAGRFELTINQAFDSVVEGCRAQHESSCWLLPQLVKAFRAIHEHSTAPGGRDGNVVHDSPSSSTIPSFPTKLFDDDSDDPSSPARVCHLRLYSIEIWNRETHELVGGELGYTVGSIYTSLTGFADEDSAGSVQMASLGSLLIQQNFTLWDLGMDMEYKRTLGATLMSRKDFVESVHAVRESHGHLTLKLDHGGRMNCKDILVANRSDDQNATTSELRRKKGKRNHPT